jgi:ABC-type branched-subunit amino acid transport system ATPase component
VAETFFDGSPAELMASLLDEGAAGLSENELDRLSTLIDRARRKEG